MSAKVQYPRIDLRTPRMRLVNGDPTKYSDIGYQNKKLDTAQCYFGCALPKNDPGTMALLQQIVTHAWTSYQNVPVIAKRLADGLNTPAWMFGVKDFAWKIEDGDAGDNPQKEGWAGCVILKFATSIQFRCCDRNNNQIDPKMIPLGNYVDVGFSTCINGLADDNAGIFLNPHVLRLLDYGPIIVPGRTINQIMGDAPPPPPGAQMQPSTPASAPGGNVPQMTPAPTLPPAGGPAPTLAPPPMLPGAPAAPQDAAAVAAQHGVPHHPGYRFNPATRQYEVDAPLPPVAPPVNGPAVPAGALPAAGALPTPPVPGSTIAYPSNVAPHPSFLSGGVR